ncbi:MAG: hypothetical protein U0R70_06390 [Solirubrobacteraceae bacterium]
MPDGPARRTSITRRAMRADVLHRLLASGAPALILDDVHALPALRNWPRRAVDVAIGDLVADGRLADDECGRLVIREAAA